MRLRHLAEYGMDEFLAADFRGGYGTCEGAFMIVNMALLD